MPGRPFSGKAKKEQLKAKKAGKRDEGDGGGDLSGWGRKRLEGLAGMKPGSGRSESEVKGKFGMPKAFGGGGGGGGRPPKQTNIGERYGLRSLKTVFEREPQDQVDKRKAQANEPIVRAPSPERRECAMEHVSVSSLSGQGQSDSKKSITWRRVMAYPCVVPGTDNNPIVPIPMRPTWNENTSPEQLEESEKKAFTAWMSGIYEQFPRERLNFFEHNLEVWRQLWRALERSDIALVILDARCPLFHFPEAIYSYITKDMGMDVCCLINKVDLVPPAATTAWVEFFEKKLPGVSTVPFFVPKSGSGRVDQPCVEAVLEAIKRCTVRRAGQEPCKAAEWFDEGKHTGDRNKDAITICLVGDPNMGKSSVMNSIFGKKVVSSSRTPGHTKHIQTYFLTPSVCFCDSPGIVSPKVDIPKSLQVLFGSYPIAQLREPYSAIRKVAETAKPSLQELYHLKLPEDAGAWTALNLCESLAYKLGIISKGGRPDMYRAANMILRDVLGGGKICLCFGPPGWSPVDLPLAVQEEAEAAWRGEDQGEGGEGEGQDSEEDEEDEEDEDGEDAYKSDSDDELEGGLDGQSAANQGVVVMESKGRGDEEDDDSDDDVRDDDVSGAVGNPFAALTADDE